VQIFVLIDSAPKQDWFAGLTMAVKSGDQNKVISHQDWRRLVAKWQARPWLACSAIATQIAVQRTKNTAFASVRAARPAQVVAKPSLQPSSASTLCS
jgi:hypothetical protein